MQRHRAVLGYCLWLGQSEIIFLLSQEMSDRLVTALQQKQHFMALPWCFIHRFIMFARGAQNKAACIPVVHVLHVVLCWMYSIVERSGEVGGWGVLHVFPIDSQTPIYRNQAANLHVMVKNCLQTQHYFSREDETVHFANWLLQESVVLQYPRPPPCSPLVETRKATKPIPSCEDGMWIYDAEASATEQGPIPIWAGSHWEIYGEDDTTDYSRLLRRIGRGL